MEGYLAQVILFAGNFAPRGWAFCHGQLLPINQYQALFALLGNTYGGDGRTTFGLPDLRGRAPIGAGRGPGLSDYRLGVRGGSETNVLTVNQMPSHSHALTASTTTAAQAKPGNAIRLGHAGADVYTQGASDTTLASDSIQSTGAGQPQNNMQPFLGLNYIICLNGIFPSRN